MWRRQFLPCCLHMIWDIKSSHPQGICRGIKVTGLSALNLPQPLVWILAFAIIFGLLAAFAHLLKRIAGSRAAELEGGRNRVPRLGLVDSFDLDRHRKLIIVRRDNVEHLLLVGPSDVVVESNIVRAASASPREERMAPVVAVPTGPSVQLGPTPMPIPPTPATPQTIQGQPPQAQPIQGPAAPAPAKIDEAPIAPATPPVMPSAPFPVPPPVRPLPQGKSTMPPPPPFGAPKRGTSAPNPRVEPILTSIIGGAANPTEKAPVAEKPAAVEPAAPAAPQPKAAAAPEEKSVAVQEPKPVATEPEKHNEPAPVAKPVEPAPTVATTSPLPEIVSGIGAPVAPAERKAAIAAALSPDLSAKLEDVLKVKITPDTGIRPEAPRAPLPPLPPLPPLKPAAPSQPETGFEPLRDRAAPAGTTTEIVHSPEPVPAEPAAPPAPPVDAFEEELRRILGRAPQKT